MEALIFLIVDVKLEEIDSLFQKRIMDLVGQEIICVRTDKSKLFVFYGPDCIITVLHAPGPVRAGMSGLGRSLSAKLWASFVDPMV